MIHVTFSDASNSVAIPGGLQRGARRTCCICAGLCWFPTSNERLHLCLIDFFHCVSTVLESKECATSAVSLSFSDVAIWASCGFTETWSSMKFDELFHKFSDLWWQLPPRLWCVLVLSPQTRLITRHGPRAEVNQDPHLKMPTIFRESTNKSAAWDLSSPKCHLGSSSPNSHASVTCSWPQLFC